MTTATENPETNPPARAGWFAPRARRRLSMSTRNGHQCSTFTLADGRSYSCEHGHVVPPHDVANAIGRAARPAEDLAASAPAAIPGQSASERSALVVGKTDQGGRDRSDADPFAATFIACALALEGTATSGLDLTREQAQRMVNNAVRNGVHRVRAWRQYTYESLWDGQWRWAVRTTQRLFPDATGAAHLTEDHTAADLPDVAAARC